MTQHISKHTLYAFRNAIPIDELIAGMPGLAAQKTQGHLRFLCPLCSGFHTATNPKTNLARCFDCKRNFNTIDLVMQVQNLNFKDAISVLSARFKHLPGVTSAGTDSNPARSGGGALTSIRQILEAALTKT